LGTNGVLAKILATKSNERSAEQQALSTDNFTIFHALHEVLVKKKEKQSIKHKFLHKIRNRK
jgi:hypothetical protein